MGLAYEGRLTKRIWTPPSRRDTSTSLLLSSLLVRVPAGGGDADELRRSDCSRISGLSYWSGIAPGHDEIRARGANRCTGQKWPRLLPAFPRAGLTGSSISSNRNRAAAGKIVCCSSVVAGP